MTSHEDHDFGGPRNQCPYCRADLEAENALLQEQVGEHMQRRAEAEEEARRLQMCEGMARDMAVERDGYKARDKVRVEALAARGCERRWPSGATCLTVGTKDDPLGANVRPPVEVHLRCPSCAAIAMTPEEARARCNEQD